MGKTKEMSNIGYCSFVFNIYDRAVVAKLHAINKILFVEDIKSFPLNLSYRICKRKTLAVNIICH